MRCSVFANGDALSPAKSILLKKNNLKSLDEVRSEVVGSLLSPKCVQNGHCQSVFKSSEVPIARIQMIMASVLLQSSFLMLKLLVENGGGGGGEVVERGGGLPYEKVGDALQEFWVLPVRGTEKGVIQAFFNPQKAVPKVAAHGLRNICFVINAFFCR